MVNFSFVNKEHTKSGKAAFFEPFTLIDPDRACFPFIINVDITVTVLSRIKA
jgi:hypothetical protein